MSSESTAPTSSTLTANSWNDLAKLGEYILDQLGRDRRSEDLLVHWIAHRLAERLHTAETADDPGARDAARESAALLITQLWQARSGWPQGWPPDAVRKFADGVRGATGQSYPDEKVVPLPPWLSTLGELIALQSEEREAWVNGALLELDGDGLRRTLEVAPDDASEPTDLSDIRRQLRRYEEAEDWIAAHAQDSEDASRRADRARILGRVLEGLAERRAELIERALKDARRGQRRKPALQGARSAAARGGGSRRGSRKANK
jgi:hypothetical protein